MVKIRHLVLVGLTLTLTAMALFPFAAGAAPQVYGSADQGHSIAFAVAGSRVSLLGLDTRSYCGYTEPLQNQKPRPYHRLAAPVFMHDGSAGFSFHQDETELSEKQGTAELTVTAGFSGDALIGDFTYLADARIESSRCQTGTWYPGEATVPFEAVPFVRADAPGAPAPSAGETPIYFARKGPLEVFMRGEGKRLLVRGAVVSGCRFGGAHRSRRSPFFGIPFPLPLEWESFGGYFGKNAGRLNGAVVTEVTHLAGYATGSATNGVYSRKETIGTGADARICTIGPLRFHAVRYVPAAS